jgi:hypothetical protein
MNLKPLPAIVFAFALIPPAFADDKADATKVVDSFYANYITAIIKRERGEKVVQRSPQLSPAFKKVYAELQAKAWKEDPELGLGYDPIICGQDFPDAGYAVKTIELKGNTGSAVAVSKDKNFEGSIPVTLVTIDGKWFINGIEKLQGK